MWLLAPTPDPRTIAGAYSLAERLGKVEVARRVPNQHELLIDIDWIRKANPYPPLFSGGRNPDVFLQAVYVLGGFRERVPSSSPDDHL